MWIAIGAVCVWSIVITWALIRMGAIMDHNTHKATALLAYLCQKGLVDVDELIALHDRMDRGQ